MEIAAMSTKPTSMFRRWFIVLTASLLFFYTFIQLNMLNAVSSSLMHDLSINAEQFGNLSALYFYGNFLLLFPAGLLLDRFSTRKILLTAMVIGSASMFGFAISHNLMVISASRFFAGVAGSFAFLGAIRLASRWFEPKHMALVSGFIVTMAMLGGMVAQTPMSLLSDHVGWRQAMMYVGFLGIAITIFMFFVLRDWPADAMDKMESSKAELSSLGFWRSIRMVVFNQYNWMGGVYTSLMNLPIFLLGALWGSMYLTQIDHLTRTQASSAIAMIFLGTIFGSPLIGWFSDKIKRRILPMVGGAILSLGVMLVIIYIPNLSFGILLGLFFLLGLITSTQVLSYPLIAELNSPLVTSSAISIVSLLLMASGFVFQPLFGYLMDLHWKHLILHNVAIYSLQDFKLALAILPIAFILSMVVAFLIKETRCELQVKD